MHPIRLIPLLALLLVAAGCGSDEDADLEAPATSAGSTEVGDEPIVGGGAGDVPSSELTIRVWPEGPDAGEPDVYTLTCLPDAGTVPDPPTACEAVRSSPFLFAPAPPDQVCTQQYGGPQQAEVTGRVQDIAVKADFSRTDGCAIALWDRAAALLPVPAGAGS